MVKRVETCTKVGLNSFHGVLMRIWGLRPSFVQEEIVHRWSSERQTEREVDPELGAVTSAVDRPYFRTDRRDTGE